MKYFLWGIFGVFLSIVAILIAIPYFVDLNDYKETISAAVKRYTGRQLTIEGDAKLSLIPSFRLELSDITLDNAAEAGSEPMVKVAQLEMEIAVFPLILKREVHVEKFILKSPEINLFVSKNGHANWQFDHSAVNRDFGAGDSDKKSENIAKSTNANQVLLGAVGIEDGILRYKDEQSGADIVLTEISNNIALEGLDKPLLLSGSAVWNNQTITGEIRLNSPSSLMKEKETELSAQISSELGFIEYMGTLRQAKTIATAGKLQIKTADSIKLAQWLGAEINTHITDPQSLSLTSVVDIKADSIQLVETNFILGKTAATGDVSVNLKSKVPYVKAKVAVDTLDLSPFFENRHEEKLDTVRSSPDKSSLSSEGWSEELIAFDALKAVDADVELQVSKAHIPPIHMGKISAKLALKKGILTTSIQAMEFYEGEIKGQVILDASGNTPFIKKRMALHHVNVEPYLQDAVAFDRLSGALDATMDVEARGKSEKAIISSLKGKGNFFVADGKLKGVDLAKMVQNVASAFTGVKAESEEGTDFSELSGSVLINQGIVSNNDLLLKAPLVLLSGEGTANLPTKQLNYTVKPKVVGTLKGSSQADELQGIQVPVRITGPFSKPKFTPDVGNIVKDVLSDPTQVKDKLKGFEKGFRSIRDNLKKELRKEGEE